MRTASLPAVAAALASCQAKHHLRHARGGIGIVIISLSSGGGGCAVAIAIVIIVVIIDSSDGPQKTYSFLGVW